MDKANTRTNDRRRIQCDLSEYLVVAPERTPLRCMAANVSRNGLGVVGFKELAVGTDLILVLKEKGIPLKVVWSKKDPARDGIFHIGLQSQDPRHNLVTLMEGDGLIRREEAQLPDFNALQAVIAKLHTHDQATLRSDGLAKLAQTYRSYPFNCNGLSMAALIPNAMRPADFAFMEADEAAKSLIILLSERKGVWRRFWPQKTSGEID